MDVALGAARGDGGSTGLAIIADQRLDGDAERHGEAGKQRDRHAALADFVEGKLRPRDGERVGELDLRQIGGGGRITSFAIAAVEDSNPLQRSPDPNHQE